MKRFCQVILFFLVILCCINICLDLYVTHSLQQCQSRKFVGWSDITQKQLDADLLIMGNSRAWSMYSPAILDSILHVSTYNLGMDGSPLNRQIMKYDIYRHFQQRKPRYVIMNIDYMTMGWRFGYEREQFFPYIQNEYMRKEIRKIEPFNVAELYIPMYRYLTYKGVRDLLAESRWEDGVYKGYLGEDEEWDEEFYKQIETLHFVKDDRTITMLDSFLMSCKQEEIDVLFCYAPIYSGISQKIDNFQEMLDTYQEYADRYDIRTLNYMESSLCDDTFYFRNATHMNKRGAELFSIRLAEDLEKLGIIQSENGKIIEK